MLVLWDLLTQTQLSITPLVQVVGRSSVVALRVLMLLAQVLPGRLAAVVLVLQAALPLAILVVLVVLASFVSGSTRNAVRSYKQFNRTC
jgi:hypothetical protein